MKTAISIPDKVFQSAERVARRLGVSRSELYVTALKGFLERHRDDRVREKLDEVYGSADSRLDPALQTLQSRSLRKKSW
ncbi:MAG: hypothetical protein ACT4O3_02330 [Elusimicrobiota bacterium]